MDIKHLTTCLFLKFQKWWLHSLSHLFLETMLYWISIIGLIKHTLLIYQSLHVWGMGLWLVCLFGFNPHPLLGDLRVAGHILYIDTDPTRRGSNLWSLGSQSDRTTHWAIQTPWGSGSGGIVVVGLDPKSTGVCRSYLLIAPGSYNHLHHNPLLRNQMSSVSSSPQHVNNDNKLEFF